MALKFLIVGLGSMGKRRIRNLTQLEAGEIIGFDLSKERRLAAEEQFKIKTYEKFEDAMETNPDALIISTPPDLHMLYALKAAKSNKHFFTEASVVDDGFNELIAECENKKITAAPSCTMRFFPEVKAVKEIVDNKTIGKVVSFTYHSGQYLPDWHPWEDYKKFYVSKRSTGAAREIVSFELVWLVWLLGDINRISCFKDKTINLDIDIDDTYQILMKFDSGVVGHMLVDVVSRVADRSCKIFGEEGVIFWDWGESIRVYTAKDKKWSVHKPKVGTTVAGYSDKIHEEPYIEEMNAFINSIKGTAKYPYTYKEDKKVLETLYAAEKSSDSGVHKKLS